MESISEDFSEDFSSVFRLSFSLELFCAKMRNALLWCTCVFIAVLLVLGLVPSKTVNCFLCWFVPPAHPGVLSPSAGPGLSGEAAALQLSVATRELHLAVRVLGDDSPRTEAMSFS